MDVIEGGVKKGGCYRGRKWLKKWTKTKANPQMGVMGGGLL